MRITNNSGDRVSVGTLNISVGPFATVTVDTLKAMGNEELQSYINSGVLFIADNATSGTPFDNFVEHDTELGAGTTAKRPTAKANIGQMYYDTTIGKPIWFKSPGWVLADGTAA